MACTPPQDATSGDPRDVLRVVVDNMKAAGDCALVHQQLADAVRRRQGVPNH